MLELKRFQKLLQTTNLDWDILPSPKKLHVSASNDLRARIFYLQAFWKEKADDTNQMRNNMGSQLTDLTQAVSVGQKYLDDFVQDNQISESFYK